MATVREYSKHALSHSIHVLYVDRSPLVVVHDPAIWEGHLAENITVPYYETRRIR